MRKNDLDKEVEGFEERGIENSGLKERCRGILRKRDRLGEREIERKRD